MAIQKIYYCNSCQKGSQYSAVNNKITALTASISGNPQIASDFYQTSYALLKEVRDFGSKDDNATRLPNVASYFALEIKNLRGEIISHHGYDDIVNCMNNNSNSNKQGEKIYGSYWTNLRSTLTNINIPSTRYYEQSCCDCDGYCESDGWYCPSYCPCYGECDWYDGCQDVTSYYYG